MIDKDSEAWKVLEREIRERYHLIEDTHGHQYAQRALVIWDCNATYNLTLQQLQRIIYGDRFVDVQEDIKARKIKSITRNTLHDLGELNT